MSDKIEYTPRVIAERKSALKLKISELENELAINFEEGKSQLEEELINKLLVPISAAKLADLGFSLAANIVTSKVENMLSADEEDSAFKQGMSPIIKALLPELLEAILIKVKTFNDSHHEEDAED